MTQRLYYADSRLCAFDARVASCEAVGDRFHVRLDRTAFYPMSGGQPFDLGRLGDAAVVDVVDRDDEIVHVVTGALEPGAIVHGAVDVDRRLDHMQQHSGQHVLSAAFDRVCGVPTVGFHMGTAASTIDLSREVTESEVTRAEREANRVIWEDRTVGVRIVPAEQVPQLGLRRASARSGPLRIVEIDDFDVSACGGTHVGRTGEIGIVAATGSERVRGGTRLSFVCGGRALAEYRRVRDAVDQLGRLLSVGVSDVVPHVVRLQQAVRDADRALGDMREELVRGRAIEAAASAETIGRHRVVIRADAGMDAAGLKQMAQALTAGSGLVVVLVGAGEPAAVVVARSGDVQFDAGAFMKNVTGALGGRGGGRPEMAQGGVAAAHEDVVRHVRRALEMA